MCPPIAVMNKRITREELGLLAEAMVALRQDSEPILVPVPKFSNI